MDFNELNTEVADKIRAGAIGIIPTDTIYGIVCSALNPKSVEKLRAIRGKPVDKPLLILVADINDIKHFDIFPDSDTLSVLDKVWPGSVTALLPIVNKSFDYLSAGTGNLGVRFPSDPNLRKFLSRTGPLVAPSANKPRNKPAWTLDEAKEYFPDLDFYVNGGTLTDKPSTIIKIEGGRAKVVRQGAADIPGDLIFHNLA